MKPLRVRNLYFLYQQIITLLQDYHEIQRHNVRQLLRKSWKLQDSDYNETELNQRNLLENLKGSILTKLLKKETLTDICYKFAC